MSHNSKLFDDWQSRRQTEAEIAALGLGGLGETDFGASSVFALAQLPEEQLLRMHWIAGLLGAADPLAHDADLQRDAGLTCAGCSEIDRCHAAFADPSGPTASEAADFCPNAEIYRRAANAG